MRKSWFQTLILGVSFCALLVGCSAIEFPPVAEQVERDRAAGKLLKQASILMEVNTPQALREAEGALRLASEISPKEPRAIDGLGCVAFRRKNFADAEKFFKQALEIDPDYAAAWAHLALIAERRGHFRSAKALHQHSLAKNPLNYRARNNYAVFMLGNEEAQEMGLQELQKALAQGGAESAILLNNMGFALGKAGVGKE